MCNDNGIYIAEFDDGWRVTHVAAIENLGYYPPGSPEASYEIWRYFWDGLSPLPSRDEAFSRAREMLTELHEVGCPLEYGIQLLGFLGKWEDWTGKPKPEGAGPCRY